jgi:proline dehydrogenase
MFAASPMSALKYFARRFVAGETAREAVEAARKVNQRGLGAILDFLGEYVKSAENTSDAVSEYLHLLDAIHDSGVRAGVSLKASQMGLMVSPELCFENLMMVSERAKQYGITLWLDMEGSDLTQKTIDIFDRLRSKNPNVGLCIQAYLVRSGGDLDRLMRQPLKVRLCKGAYKEPATIAYTHKKAVDGSYRMLSTKLLENVSRSIYPAFATHDQALIQEIVNQAKSKGVLPKQFEFEMLYGIQNRYLEALVEQQGLQGQVYIPYGKSWLPYFMRRVRERKENLYFLLRNLFRM